MLGALVVAAFLCAAAERDRTEKPPNPLAGQPAAITQGRLLFRGYCGHCHGMDARGGARGPDLTAGRFLHGDTDAALLKTIQAGVPGTQMPANELTDEETWQVVAWLRSVQAASPVRLTGDRVAGERIFWKAADCGRCHAVLGRGGRLGPDLTRIGAERSPAFLVESIREPGKRLSERPREPLADFGQQAQPYQAVTVTLEGGGEVIGVVLAEDNFSIQVMDAAEAMHSFQKKDIARLTRSRTSAMPAYDASALSAKELDDLLAYLDSLKGR